MIKNRTIEELRKNFKGVIYVILKGDDVVEQFFQDAEKEGYRFGKIHPLDNPRDDVISIGGNKQLSYVGFVGRMRIMCDRSEHFHMIDYAKYISGENNFLYKYNSEPKFAKTEGRFCGEIEIIGEKSKLAKEYLGNEISKCKTPKDEENIIEQAIKKFDVIVLYGEDK